MARSGSHHRDEEASSWLFTAVGIAVIAAVLAFLGFANPSDSDRQTLEEVAKLPTRDASPVGSQHNSQFATLESPLPKIAEPKIAEPKITETRSQPQPPPSDQPVFPGDVLEEPGLHVRLPFGRDAKERCLTDCNSDACNQSCHRLLADNFARRILPKELNHDQLAETAASSCDSASFVSKPSGDDLAFLTTIVSPPDYFEEEEIRRRIQQVRAALTNISVAKLSDSMRVNAERWPQIICLYEGSLVSSMAVARAAKKHDSISELAYRRYEAAFSRKLGTLLSEMRG